MIKNKTTVQYSVRQATADHLPNLKDNGTNQNQMRPAEAATCCWTFEHIVRSTMQCSCLTGLPLSPFASVHLNPARCSRKGCIRQRQNNGGGLFHDFPQPRPHPASSAITRGIPCRHIWASPHSAKCRHLSGAL